MGRSSALERPFVFSNGTVLRGQCCPSDKLGGSRRNRVEGNSRTPAELEDKYRGEITQEWRRPGLDSRRCWASVLILLSLWGPAFPPLLWGWPELPRHP